MFWEKFFFKERVKLASLLPTESLILERWDSGILPKRGDTKEVPLKIFLLNSLPENLSKTRFLPFLLLVTKKAVAVCLVLRLEA